MRDILSDLEEGRLLADSDPVKRTREQMRTSLPKRFYSKVAVAPGEGGFHVLLDGKPVKTPAKATLTLPGERLAALIAAEFAAQGDRIDPVTMPIQRLANTAIDGVAGNPQAVLEDILRFASSDLVCYRADGPEGLVARQAEAWNPVLEWAERSLGARFALAEGIMHVGQPHESMEALAAHLRQRAEPMRLAAMHLVTSLTGSALLALAVEAGALDAESAWIAAHVDEAWNAAHWGEDAEALRRQVVRKRDMMAAARLLEALGDRGR